MCLSLFQLCSSQQSKLYPVGAVGLPAAPAETQIIVFILHLCKQHLARFKPTANTETKLSFGEKKTFLRWNNWYGRSWESQRAVGKQWERMGFAWRCWFLLETCCVTSTLHGSLCLTKAAKLVRWGPVQADRWSFWKRATAQWSVCGGPLEPPGTNTISVCWERTGA